MPRNQNRRFRQPAVPAESTTKPDANEKEYRAPTVGLEDKIFTVGTTAGAAKFEMVKEEVMEPMPRWHLRLSQNHHI